MAQTNLKNIKIRYYYPWFDTTGDWDPILQIMGESYPYLQFGYGWAPIDNNLTYDVNEEGLGGYQFGDGVPGWADVNELSGIVDGVRYPKVARIVLCPSSATSDNILVASDGAWEDYLAAIDAGQGADEANSIFVLDTTNNTTSVGGDVSLTGGNTGGSGVVGNMDYETVEGYHSLAVKDITISGWTGETGVSLMDSVLLDSDIPVVSGVPEVASSLMFQREIDSIFLDNGEVLNRLFKTSKYGAPGEYTVSTNETITIPEQGQGVPVNFQANELIRTYGSIYDASWNPAPFNTEEWEGHFLEPIMATNSYADLGQLVSYLGSQADFITQDNIEPYLYDPIFNPQAYVSNAFYPPMDWSNTTSFSGAGNIDMYSPIAQQVSQAHRNGITVVDGDFSPELDPFFPDMIPIAESNILANWNSKIERVILRNSHDVDENGYGIPDNKVIAYVIFRDDVAYQPVYGEDTVYVDFDGETRFIGEYSNTPYGMPANIEIETNLETPSDVTLRDEIHVGSPYFRSGSQRYSGDENEKIVYPINHSPNLKSTNKANVAPTIIGGKWNIAAAGYIKLNQHTSARRYFTELPYLETNHSDNIKIHIRKKTKLKNHDNSKEHEYITECFFSILYKNNRDTHPSKPLKCSIKYKTASYDKKMTASPVVRGIDFGSTKINTKGENREIRIYGDPGAQWALAINENFETTALG